MSIKSTWMELPFSVKEFTLGIEAGDCETYTYYKIHMISDPQNKYWGFVVLYENGEIFNTYTATTDINGIEVEVSYDDDEETKSAIISITKSKGNYCITVNENVI